MTVTVEKDETPTMIDQVLAFLQANPTKRYKLSEIAEELKLCKSNLQTSLTRLAKGRWIYREKVYDITDHGYAHFFLYSAKQPGGNRDD